MTAPAKNDDHASLAELDARIAEQPMGALTLDPGRSSASSLTELVADLADPSQSAYLTAAAAAVAEGQLQSFPGNLFWDFDFYLGSIHRHAAASTDYAGYLRKVSLLTVDLMQLYGQHSTIRFRYVHDFMYGFDWARWLRRDPSARQGVEPFGLSFLQQIEGRGRDILTLVETDDGWYPKLDDGTSRNPFPFSRETDDELPLYRLLAKRGDIPVEAWRLDARPDAGRDFDALREEAASSLGLSR